MSEQTPSQAEGEPDTDTGREPTPDEQVPRTTPSQAEGERDDETETQDANTDTDADDDRP
ncbi:hypothetical protein [Streptomyces neyagawaensis]|uniref:Uncharacterized protein n=1 Tax=Streptomyces neyagawaensis TaxID=42238 RepID=A0ABV3B504_9ACTN